MKRKLTAATAIALAVTLLLTACGALPELTEGQTLPLSGAAGHAL